MPANLTPQYLKAEQAYRRATTSDEELRCLEEMLRELPKHKGTDKLQAELKQKISRLKKEGEAPKSGRRTHSAKFQRQGAGRVVLLGGPNAGKSQLMQSVTRATPEVASYPFTTREPLPAMMPWEDISIQLIDTPAITRDLLDPTTQGLIRGADLALLLLDLGDDDGLPQCLDVINRLNETKTRLANRSYLDETDLGLSFTHALLVPNKLDLPDAPLRWELDQEGLPEEWAMYPISALDGTGLPALQQAIFAALDVVRVYTKLPTARDPDYSNPFTIRRGGTLAEIAEQIHKDYAARFKSAKVWGSAVHDGTMVKPDYVLHDRDVVELHMHG